MTLDQILISALLVIALVLFVLGRPRYDLVALGTLLTGVVLGLVPAKDAFSGFGHDAVITVAAVLAISRALALTGALEPLTGLVRKASANTVTHILVLCGIGAVISAFMNNVGALALLMPIAIQSTTKAGRSPAGVLMPLAFSTVLGGMVTLIGTPPNVIVSGFRAQAMGEPYHLLDFAWVGLPAALAGLVYMAVLGWRLIPGDRLGKGAVADLMDVGAYMTELTVKPGSPLIDRTVGEAEASWTDSDLTVVGLIRDDRRIFGAMARQKITEGDVLLVRGESEAITRRARAAGLDFAASERPSAEHLQSQDVVMAEVVVGVGSPLIGRHAGELGLRETYGINLLALSREGAAIRSRLGRVRMQIGDVLLLQGDSRRLQAVMADLRCLPLVERDIIKHDQRRGRIALGLFGAGIALAASGLLPAAVAFAMVVLGLVVTNALPVRELYTGIEWPVIVLLGAMIPLGAALESTGVTGLIADGIVGLGGDVPVWVLLAALLVVTMTLSDILNNAATAVIMAPISIAVAQGIGVSPDPFLMAVAIGASSSFLTPIGHQNNALVMGPGGYHFGDYWRVGLPLEIVVAAVSVPLLLLFWPL
ncbi:SLC13 family permease [Tistrella mobilis]|uniref:TrkA domain-containing protein n=1 Tax=Tistrella mobilis (strain KA081020-065) TaxID=1110502 RepID=I3TMH3_TISMK|nr:SLC13 family permease [Tistrella mobilis]AFK53961.1 TrkA domain-containing protein [Tistrella mobilis KA081020-065]MAM76217.1 cation transporter [Tistrella sp.]